MSKNLFEAFDFELLESPDFKEDSVREVLVMPLLQALGYENSGSNRIIRSKGLSNPYVKMGSKRLQIRMIPDYLCEVDGRYAWVLEALVHKSKNRRVPSLCKPELGNRVTFRHTKMGHFVER